MTPYESSDDPDSLSIFYDPVARANVEKRSPHKRYFFPGTSVLSLHPSNTSTPNHLAQAQGPIHGPRAEERGALSFDDAVERFLPGFGTKGKSQVTLRRSEMTLQQHTRRRQRGRSGTELLGGLFSD